MGAGAAVALTTGLLVALPETTVSALQSTLPAVTSPTWQTNGAVRTTIAAGGNVYLGGDFSSVRPPGSGAGTGEVARTRLAAFSATSGALVTSFNHTFNGNVRVLALSPDKKTLYVGGEFTTVDGSARSRLAAFDVASGALTSWAPVSSGTVNALAASSTRVYVGGAFSKLANVTTKNIGAVGTDGSAVPGFVGNPDNVIYGLALSPAGDKLFLAGAFTTYNGDATYHAAASLNPTNAAVIPFPAVSAIPVPSPACSSVSKVVITDGTKVYYGNEGTGGGCFDGTFAASLSDGSLVWQNQCLGATQGIALLNNRLYVGSHAHDCSANTFDPDAFGEVGWSKGLARHLLAYDASNGTVSSWYPNTNGGTGSALGPRTLATDGTSLFVGGEFTSVNGTAQQGFTRFSPLAGGASALPGKPGTPRASVLPDGSVNIAVQPPLDNDDTDLTLRLYRDGGATAVATVDVHSLFWKRPTVTFVEKGLAAGSTHSWTVDAVEKNGTLKQASAKSSSTGNVTISPVKAYQAAVDADSPSFFWRLGEPAGPVAVDASASGSSGAYNGTVTYAQPGPITGDPTAIAVNGVDGLVVSNKTSSQSAFSAEAWFKTTSTTGGKIIGFGNVPAGFDFSGNPAISWNYDKHVYMTDDGHLVFGVWNGQADTITSPTSLNDGQWHHVVATQGATGMALYVDAVRVGKNGVTTNQPYDGYWRVGGDNIGGWPGQPTSSFFAGTLADVAVYPTALSTTQVRSHWTASGRVAPPIVTPADAYGSAVYADEPLQYWRLDETSGTTLADASNNNATGLVQGTPTLGVSGALGATGKAISLDGASYLTSAAQTSSPSAYSLELWFNTTTTTGGKLLGFGDAQTGDSGSYDKHVYLDNDGKLVFGVYNGGFDMLTSTNAVNDGAWHHVVATQGPSGMALYVDGVLDQSNGVTNNQGYNGYWRAGGDNLNFWPDQPTTSYVTAKVDEVAVYGGALSAARVAAHYTASGNNIPDTQAPAVSLTAPADGATVTGTVAISANATDDKAVAQVEFFVDGVSVGVDSLAPYSVSWNTALSTPGVHVLTAVAKDTANKTTTSASRSVTIPTPDTTNPDVNVTSPAAGNVAYGPTTISATATDNAAVAKVEFFVDGVSLGVDSSSPYSVGWNATAVGPHSITAVATDTSNNSTTSTAVAVTVLADAVLPSAPGTLSGSAAGQTSVNLSWGAATDNSGSIAGYIVTRDGVDLPGLVAGTSFTDTGLTAGTLYTYTVKAKDPTGNVGLASNAVPVTTSPAGPSSLFSYDWTAPDSIGWPSTFTALSTNGSLATAGNAGVLTVNDVAGANARAIVNAVAPRADTDVTLSYAWSSATAKAYLDVWLRGSGGWANSYRPSNGYGVELSSSSGTVSILKSVAGTQTTIGTIAGGNKLVTTKQWLRVKVVGSAISVKVWAEGTSEPAAWTTANDATVTANGQIFLALNRASTNVGAKSVAIDDLVVNPGA